MYKQTFSLKLKSNNLPYEFNMLTEDINISPEEVKHYFAENFGFTLSFVYENTESLWRVIKNFEPIE